VKLRSIGSPTETNLLRLIFIFFEDPTILVVSYAVGVLRKDRAEEALRALGLWDRLQDKIVFGENIAQTAKYVQTGAVEIGIIALSLVVDRELASKGGYALIADNLHSPIEQAYIITKQGGEKSLAKAFARYIENPHACRIMIKYGFVLPRESAAPPKPDAGLLPRINQSRPVGSVGKH